MLRFIGLLGLVICLTAAANETQRMAIENDSQHFVECLCSVDSCDKHEKFDHDERKCVPLVSTPGPECENKQTRATAGDSTKTKFDFCKDGKWETGTCPEGQHYDPDIKACD